MAETKQIEVTQMTKADKEVAPEKTGKLQATPPKEEAGGRAHYWKVGQCTVCGYIGYYWYDTNRWHGYNCANCNALLIA